MVGHTTRLGPPADLARDGTARPSGRRRSGLVRAARALLVGAAAGPADPCLGPGIDFVDSLARAPFARRATQRAARRTEPILVSRRRRCGTARRRPPSDRSRP